MDTLLPAPPDFDAQVPLQVRLNRAVESNVRWTLRQILESPEWEARRAEGRMKVVGAIYEIENGRVRLLE